MEKSNKRGKIPQSDWPQIMARYEAGETLASIAKTYDCSPPAISYIVSRSRAQRANGSAAEAAVEPHVAPEPQLIKAHPHDGTSNPSHALPVFAAASAPEPAAASPAETPQVLEFPAANGGAGLQGNGGSFQHRGYGRDTANSGFPGLPPAASRPAADAPAAIASASNGEHREKLHLSLGNGSAHHNGATTAEQHDVAQERGLAEQTSYPARHQEPRPQPALAARDAPRDGYPQQGSATNRPGNGGPAVASGGYLDTELRSRVDRDIAAFLSAFDAALLQDSQESRSALREATDRLLRAGARTRIELERLEARTPLPPREVNRFEPAWRSR